MTKENIIKTLAENRTVEKIVNKINIYDKELANELSQEIYLILLEKEDDQIIKAYNEKTLINFIKRIIYCQYHSDTSHFFRKFKRWNNNKINNSNEIFRNL